jgi:dipeptidyl aminopeptidase/acylaminoacyl peptidase
MRENRLEELTAGAALRAGIAWSPGQRWLAATRDADTVGIVELREPDSGRVAATFAAEGVLGDLLWSPDGSRLFVRSNRSSPFILDVSDDGTMRPGPELPRATYAGWTPAGDRLFASQRVGMGSRLMLVDATSGAISPLTSGIDVAVAVGTGGTAQAPVAVYTVENGSQPKALWFAELNVDEGLLMRPTRMTDSHSWLDSVALSRTQIFEWHAADSTRLQAQLFLPPEGLVEPGTPTPLVVIPYGGFTNTFPSGDDLMTMGIQVLTAKGWTVVRPNTRGIFGGPQNDRYGALQLEDTERLLDALIAERMIDPDRIAVFGHSHGGAMAYYYLTHSDRFTGAIAVNGAADWISQARRRDMTGLPWGLGGTPDELPETYTAYSPLENAEHARGALLAIAAEDDSQIPPAQAREIVERLQSLGKTADLVWLSDEDHFIRKPENRVLMWSRVFDFLGALFDV